jgi:Domain of unknown function (DUF4410)
MKTFCCAAFLAAILFGSNWSGPDFVEASSFTLVEQAATSGTKPTVYVSNFEIDAVPATTPVQKPEDDPRRQANRLVELMSTKLVAALQRAGYNAVRMAGGRPESGVQIRGLFAEVDQENHWRRAVIRGAAESGKIQAVVSVANLAKPDQAMYEIAPLPGNENKPGAVITLSPYVPLTKYDLSKDAKEADFQKAASQMVNDLTALLNANPAAFAQ